jgi:hypothetical protein
MRSCNVDYISTNRETIVQRMQRRQSIAEGGWSIFGLTWGGYGDAGAQRLFGLVI